MPDTNAAPVSQDSKNHGGGKSKLKKILMAVVLVAIVGGLGYGAYRYYDSRSQNTSDVEATVVTVTISSQGFDPAEITIKSGTIVEWVSNDSSTTHIVASNPHPAHSDLPDLLSPQLGSGATYRYTFSKAGTFNYHDDQKPTTNGTIIVQE